METLESTKGIVRNQRIDDEKTSISDLCYGVGILVCTCLILYFCVMAWGHLNEILLLRALNFLILLSGICIALNLYGNKIDYFDGLKIGIGVTLIGVIPFALFIAIYLSYDTHFMQIIQQNVSAGKYLNPITAAGAVCIEGISSGAIITFSAMQYFKKQ